MPSLEFKGKSFVYKHHLSVPFRELVIDANLGLRNADGLRQDVCWKFGMPPVNNANYGSTSTQTSNKGETRKTLIEADLANAITNN